MLTVHRISSSANHVQTENCRKAKENTISTVRMRRWTLFYTLVKDEFKKNNNVCILHIPMEYLSSSFETLFGTYLNAIEIINIHNSYQQFI